MARVKGKVCQEITRELYEKMRSRMNLGERMGLDELISIGRVRVIE